MSFIGLFNGEPGSGKTLGAFSFPEPICLVLLENRVGFYIEQKERYYPSKIIDIEGCYKTKRDGIFKLLDVKASLAALEKTFRTIDLDKYQTIILDHASNIRKWLIDDWCLRHGKENVWPLDQYRIINNNTRAYLIGLINAGIELNKHIILTSTFEDDYGTVDDEKTNRKLPTKVGRVPEIKDFVTADVNWILNFYITDKGRYMVEIKKSVIGKRILDVHDNLQLYNIIQEQLKG